MHHSQPSKVGKFRAVHCKPSRAWPIGKAVLSPIHVVTSNSTMEGQMCVTGESWLRRGFGYGESVESDQIRGMALMCSGRVPRGAMLWFLSSLTQATSQFPGRVLSPYSWNRACCLGACGQILCPVPMSIPRIFPLSIGRGP